MAYMLLALTLCDAVIILQIYIYMDGRDDIRRMTETEQMGLLLRCKRIHSEHPSTVLEKFIDFLEDALDQDDSDEEEDE